MTTAGGEAEEEEILQTESVCDRTDSNYVGFNQETVPGELQPSRLQQTSVKG